MEKKPLEELKGPLGGGSLPPDEKTKKETLKLLRDLMKIPSVSGEEKKIGFFLKERLAENFKVKVQKVGNRANILAVIGKPKLLLTAHMDTVPGKLKIYEDTNFVYGRGSCDAKGTIASMITAAESAAGKGLRDFGLLFDVDEENNFEGIKKAINTVKPEFIVVGEPSSMRLINGQKGLLQLKLTEEGKSAPASMPSAGKSAINSIVFDIQSLLKLKLPVSRYLGKTTLNVGRIEGGKAPNVVADFASATVDIRTIGKNKAVIRQVRKAVGKAKLSVEMDFSPVFTDALELSRKLGIKTGVMPYFTEMYFWNKLAKTVVFGPGDYRYAHASSEKIQKKQLLNAVRVYFDIIKSSCSI
ncbi:MAG: M20/M25/M40 family metallo-hydrolase [Candidatus Parvarchaeota archaeon]|nr:M20/M25/M40 family metallo-hydrolase [Candidatus Parvarchaeota archaeon]